MFTSIRVSVLLILTVAVCSIAPSVLGQAEVKQMQAADGTDGERAEALRKNNLTLGGCIRAAVTECGGAAVFANVHIGRRGNFAVNVDCISNNETIGVTIDEKGKATKKKEKNRERRNDKDLPKIAAEFAKLKVTLDEMVAIAEKEFPGTAFNAWGFLEKEKVMVRVLVFAKAKNADGKSETIVVVVDPATKKTTRDK